MKSDHTSLPPFPLASPFTPNEGRPISASMGILIMHLLKEALLGSSSLQLPLSFPQHPCQVL